MPTGTIHPFNSHCVLPLGSCHSSKQRGHGSEPMFLNSYSTALSTRSHGQRKLILKKRKEKHNDDRHFTLL